MSAAVSRDAIGNVADGFLLASYKQNAQQMFRWAFLLTSCKLATYISRGERI